MRKARGQAQCGYPQFVWKTGLGEPYLSRYLKQFVDLPLCAQILDAKDAGSKPYRAIRADPVSLRFLNAINLSDVRFRAIW